MKQFLVVFTILYSLSANGQKKNRFRSNDTFSVYFELNVPVLDFKSMSSIDSLFYIEKIHKGVPVSIIGYADFLATDEYNLNLSRERAENVKKYMISSGLEPSAIKLLIGKGEIKRADTIKKDRGIPQDRRVDIVMEYEKPVIAKLIPTENQHGDTIRMQPSQKLVIPPSTADPGFDITNVPLGKTFILKNIYFPMGRHFPRETSNEELEKLLQAMKENPTMSIQIEGHVCCVTAVPDAYDLDSHQLDLSINRARFIYEFLKARGVDASRLKYIGFGKSRPIVINEQTEEEASVNRRVEIRILKK
jgi:outer membrane protein OmpA-like peptidoglycan-associated protein